MLGPITDVECAALRGKFYLNTGPEDPEGGLEVYLYSFFNLCVR